MWITVRRIGLRAFQFFDSIDARSVAFKCLTLYAIGLFATILLAHVMFLYDPYSGLADRAIAPVREGLEFIDKHWKASLVIVALFFPVEIVSLFRRISAVAIGDVKIDLESEGVHTKPQQSDSGDSE